MSSNRLALLCLSGERPTFTLAATSENSLHIISVDNPSADIISLKKMLNEKLPLLKSKGVTVFIDDPSGMFNEFGYKCSLSERDHDGVGILKKSLNRYFTLQKAGAITLPKNSHGFDIQPSIINERVKDSGEGYYQIDWPQLEDNARATLLLIHCAYSTDVHHVSYAKAMYQQLDTLDGSHSEEHSSFMMGLLSHGREPVKNEAIERLRAAGRVIL